MGPWNAKATKPQTHRNRIKELAKRLYFEEADRLAPL